jgi:hypothetical protein
VRLVRNVAGANAARSGVHGGIVAVLPNRQAEAPLYHLDCVLTSEDERADKAARYDEARPGHRAFGGGPLNDVLYRPERSHTRPPQPVPAEDRALIDHVLAGTTVAEPAGSGAGTRARTGPAPAGIPLVDDAEIDALAGTSPGTAEALGDGAYRAQLALAEHEDRRLAPGERRPLYVRVTNDGDTRWPWGLDQDPQIRVAYHWRDAGGTVLTFEGLRSPLPVAVGPGETAIVPVWVDAPGEPGDYLLDVDLVHEHVRWFDAPLTVEVRVAEREPRLAPAGTGTASGTGIGNRTGNGTALGGSPC